MKSFARRHIFCAALLSVAATSLSAETTDPVGAMSIGIPDGQDTLVSIPFTSSPGFVGVIDSVSSIGSGLYEINLSSTVDSAALDGWADVYYARFTSGSESGKYFTITSSTSTSLVVDSIGDDLSGLSSGNSFQVFPYFTLGTLFPPGVQTVLAESTGNLGFQRGSEILLPDQTSTGINRAPALKFFVTSTEWRDTDSFSNADDVILYPDSYFIIRQKSGIGNKSLVLYGAVPMESHVINLTQSVVANDNYVSVSRPVDVTLSELGLGTEFVDSTGNLGFQRGDELLVWETSAGINPAPDKKFFRVSGEWRDTDTFSNSNAYMIPAGSAVIIRKKAQGSDLTLFWTNTPTY